MTYSRPPIGETEFLMKEPFGLNIEGASPDYLSGEAPNGLTGQMLFYSKL